MIESNQTIAHEYDFDIDTEHDTILREYSTTDDIYISDTTYKSLSGKAEFNYQ